MNHYENNNARSMASHPEILTTTLKSPDARIIAFRHATVIPMDTSVRCETIP